MAALTLVSGTSSGAAAVAASAGVAGDSFPYPSNGITLEIKNAAGTGRTLTIVGQRACNQGVVHDRTVTIGAGLTRHVRIEGEQFRDSSGLVQLTYDDNTSVTVLAWSNS
jgi:hypothetical protein